MASDNEYWLVAVPGGKSPEREWNAISEKLKPISSCFKFSIPDLKIGTLNSLVDLSDTLNRLDTFVEGVVRKMAHYMSDIIDPEDRDKLHENLLVGPGKLPMENYVARFSWDQAKFPLRQSPSALAENISKMVTQIDNDLKQKSSSYNTLKGNLQNIERKSVGNLMTRSLNGLVDPKFLITKSEYLQTLCVVVPKAMYKEWQHSYERLSDMVVPRSTELVTEDQEYGLFTVTVFKKIVDEFKLQAREKRFAVREYEHDPQALEAERKEKEKLERDLKRQFGPLMNWLKVNFSQVFSAWLHLKALRVFSESILRYGLDSNCVSLVLKPHRRSAKSVHQALNDKYYHLDSMPLKGSKGDDHIDIPGLGLNQAEYYPYVFFKMNLNVLEK
ncbi:PREDICTED: V-type proton ATPase subunit C 1-B-like [Amphimedon queenslandica]|uniref:V-type proton ATPase subunit C n=1 Tax=Amphimedon queenslandica TaxID=400682 RepID=I1F6H1_AMPQE|nr:PREDICTED: V-type proton ATPase subunit C 1-B-like [Amphimedon queenslandica]|eukprot:XP_003389520.1 PREDICTED: V-type proton ATPase subunit C 1-B-like [Amphimedon queenslandica]